VNRREEVQAKILAIEVMPAAAAKTAALLMDYESDISDIVKAIEYDPGLASNLLRMANSAYYGFREPIGSIRDAIVRLGTAQIYKMVVSWGFSTLAERSVPGYGLASGKLWEHAIGVAVGAEQLAATLNLGPSGHAFTAGLLHDIGKIALGTFVEVDIDSILDMVNGEEVSFEIAEQEVLGIDHAEAGGMLLDSWNLPATVVEASQWHHRPESLTEHSLVVDLVHVADTMCLMGGIGAGIEGTSYYTSREVASRLHLDTVAGDTIISEILTKLNNVCGLFAAA
jgi:putative nucleotidyltransferase with HDIG domain